LKRCEVFCTKTDGIEELCEYPGLGHWNGNISSFLERFFSVELQAFYRIFTLTIRTFEIYGFPMIRLRWFTAYILLLSIGKFIPGATWPAVCSSFLSEIRNTRSWRTYQVGYVKAGKCSPSESF
jgi:hypothetical protein